MESTYDKMYRPLNNLTATTSACGSPVNWNVNIAIQPEYAARLTPTWTTTPPTPPPITVTPQIEEDVEDEYDEDSNLQQIRWYQRYRNLRRTSELM